MISTFVIATLLTVSLVNYHAYGQRADLNMAAQKLASDIRQAQSYSLSLKEFNGVSPEGGWGIFVQERNNFYRIFADGIDTYNKEYDDPGESNINFTINFPKQIKVSEVKGDGGNVPGGPNAELHITFEPPDPVVSMCSKNCSQLYNDYVEIFLANDQNDTVSVIINKFGLVDVVN